MVKFEIKSKNFRNILNAVKDCTTQIELLFKKDGMYMYTMNCNFSVYVSVFLYKDYFKTYDIQENDQSIAINIEDLQKCLKNDGDILVETKEDKSFSVKFIDKKGIFKFTPIIMTFDHYNTPDIDYILKITITCNIFKQIITTLSEFSKKCTIKYEDKVLNFSVTEKNIHIDQEINLNDIDVCKSFQEIECTDNDDDDDGGGGDKEIEKPLEIKADIDMLLLSIKSCSFSDYVNIGFKNGNPILIEYLSGTNCIKYFIQIFNE